MYVYVHKLITRIPAQRALHPTWAQLHVCRLFSYLRLDGFQLSRHQDRYYH